MLVIGIDQSPVYSQYIERITTLLSTINHRDQSKLYIIAHGLFRCILSQDYLSYDHLLLNVFLFKFEVCLPNRDLVSESSLDRCCNYS